MAIKVAINGLGRIGRCVFRAFAESGRDDIEIVAVNGPAEINTHVHLLKYDSVHGSFKDIKKSGDDIIEIAGKKVKLFRERDPLNLPWGDLEIDIVLECTGVFNDKESAKKHIEAGAKKVIISAPAKGVDSTIVFGVNNEALKADHEVISIGSCTTNCLSPVAKILDREVGIERGFMTTIHAFTGDQNIVDNRHKDLRRARTASSSIIPTSTGAAKALGIVLPKLAGKLDGVAVRVPTPNVSLVDLTFDAGRDITAEEVNEIMQKAADGELKGVLDTNDEPLVSIDYNHNTHSSIFDKTGTKVVDKRFVRVVSWYDNEWGFSVRMLDIAKLFGDKII